MQHEPAQERRSAEGRRTSAVAVSVLLAGAAIAALSLALSGPTAAAVAAPDGEWHVCPPGPPACSFATLQEAVDAAAPGDLIKVAEGVYTDLHVREGMTQVVFITESVTIRGGYTTADWGTPDPDAHPVTLDAGGQGRVALIKRDGNRKVTVTLDSLWLTNGRATGTDDGGGIYAEYTHLVITGCQVSGSTAGLKGGGVAIRYSGGAVLKSNEVYSNSAEHGGGVHVHGSVDTLVAANHVYGNRAERQGGGIHMYSSDRATVVGNVVHDNVTLIDAGGGIQVSDCDGSTVAMNQVFANVADNYAGGLWIQAGTEGVVVVENVVHDNRAVRGSAGGIRITHMSNVVLLDNRVTGNAAGTVGGGLYMAVVPTVTMVGNQFYSNTATRSGGGVYLSASSPFTMVNNVIADSEASQGGAGLYLRGTSDGSTAGQLVHNTLADNRHGNGGEAIYVEQHTTITLTNNLIADHAVGLCAQPGSTNTVTADHTLFFGNDMDTDGITIISTDAITGQDPRFVDPDDWDYHIHLSSPAVDAGADVPWLVEDIDGDSRPFGDGYDIGADEAGPAIIHLPLLVRGLP